MFPWVHIQFTLENYVKKPHWWTYSWVLTFTVTFIWYHCQRCSLLPFPTSFFYFYLHLCADMSTQTCCAITRYRIWSILFLFSELGLFLLGSLFHAEETFPDVYLRNYQFPPKNTIFTFYFPDQIFISVISHLYCQDTCNISMSRD